MPRKQEQTERYDDALAALSAATHRPTNVVNLGAGYAIRVDFAFNRYVIATNTPEGLSDDPDTVDGWHVQFCESRPEGEVVLAQAHHSWLVDAFDQVFEEVDRSGQWIESDAQLGELTQQRDSYEDADSGAPADTEK